MAIGLSQPNERMLSDLHKSTPSDSLSPKRKTKRAWRSKDSPKIEKIHTNNRHFCFLSSHKQWVMIHFFIRHMSIFTNISNKIYYEKMQISYCLPGLLRKSSSDLPPRILFRLPRQLYLLLQISALSCSIIFKKTFLIKIVPVGLIFCDYLS